MSSDRLTASFFPGRLELGAVVEAVVEGRLGRVTVAGDAARLSVGCYEIFGGDASCPEARALVAGAARPRELVYGNDAAWRQVFLDVQGDEVFDRPMLDFDPSGIDRASLLALEAGLPPGFSLCTRWSASNPVSQRLALRLGYRPAGVCEALYRR